jgi:hypothetical protein
MRQRALYGKALSFFAPSVSQHKPSAARAHAAYKTVFSFSLQVRFSGKVFFHTTEV